MMKASETTEGFSPQADAGENRISGARRTADLVFQFLQKRIISGELAAGERIDLDELTRVLGVSRTPVREALLQLETEGLVDRRPYRGAVVRGIDTTYVTETFALRLHLDTLAARVGAPRLTDDDLESMRRMLDKLAAITQNEDQHRPFNELNREFHDILTRAAGSDQLSRYLSTLGRQGERLRMHFDLHQNPSVHAQHVAIYEASLTRDPEEVVAAVRAHIVQTAAALLPADYALAEDTALLPAVLSPEEAELMSRVLAARRQSSPDT
jgi:DNA-binding GntR family transcriptional regulator